MNIPVTMSADHDMSLCNIARQIAMIIRVAQLPEDRMLRICAEFVEKYPSEIGTLSAALKSNNHCTDATRVYAELIDQECKSYYHANTNEISLRVYSPNKIRRISCAFHDL